MKKSIKLLSIVLSSLVAFSTIFTGCGANNNATTNNESNDKTYTDIQEYTGEYKTLNKDVASDRILGAYIGSAIGIGSGYEYVLEGSGTAPDNSPIIDGTSAYTAMPDKYWEPEGNICSGSIGCNYYKIGPISHPRVVEGIVYSDDDMHVDIAIQAMFNKYGANLDGFDIADGWVNYEISDVGGGALVTDFCKNGYSSQFAGQAMYGNKYWHITESWIENELNGLIFPYMSNTCQVFNEILNYTQGDLQASYLGKVFSLISSMAWEYNATSQAERKTAIISLLDRAFNLMDKNNDIYKAYQDVLTEYKNGTDWRTSATKLGAKYRRLNHNCARVGDGASMGIECNALMIFLGLVYGEGDFENSIKIASLCGCDGDCTASTVGGVLGQLYGFNALPEKYRNFLNGDSIYVNHDGSSDDIGIYWSAFAYLGNDFPSKMSFNQITSLVVSNLQAQVIARGGRVDGNTLYIKEQQVQNYETVNLINGSLENGLTSWTINKTGGATVQATTEHSNFGGMGGNAVKIMAGSSESAGISQKVTLKKGSVYRLNVMMYNTNREVRIFAGEDSRYYRPVVSTSGDYLRLELYTIGTGEEVSIGAEVVANPKTGKNNTIYFDDFALEEVTTSIGVNGQAFLAENVTLSNIECRSNGEFKLASNETAKVKVTGKNQLQTLNITYRTTTNAMGETDIYIDGIKQGTIPYASTGFELGTEVAVQTVMLSVGEGSHVIKIVGKSGNVAISKIELC